MIGKYSWLKGLILTALCVLGVFDIIGTVNGWRFWQGVNCICFCAVVVMYIVYLWDLYNSDKEE